MVLRVGTVGKVRFIRGIKKMNVFECGDNGMVVERDKHDITMYVTNAACSEIRCKVFLGTDRELKMVKFVCIAYNDHVMLLDGGDIMIVVDYDAEKVAVSRSDLKVVDKIWEEAQAPWDPAYGGMFGVYADLMELK